jgi:hypothetical protein
MPAAVSVAGAAFTVDLGGVQYECQITSGTVETNPTILRTKTLSCVAYDQVDLVSSVSLDFLYDENTGMYDALQTAIASATGSSDYRVSGRRVGIRSHVHQRSQRRVPSRWDRNLHSRT